MDARIKHVREIAACDAIDKAATRFMDDAHSAAARLENMGHVAVTDALDSAIAALLEVTKSVRTQSNLMDSLTRFRRQRAREVQPNLTDSTDA